MVMQGICIHIEGILREEKMADILIKVQENCDVNTVSLRIPSELNIMQSFSLDVASYLEKGGKNCQQRISGTLIYYPMGKGNTDVFASPYR